MTIKQTLINSLPYFIAINGRVITIAPNNDDDIGIYNIEVTLTDDKAIPLSSIY